MNAEYQKAIDEVFRIADVRGNEFVRVLDAGALTPDEFSRGALQMYHVVHFFPRFLAALIANIDDHKQRLDLVGNLMEEHGHLKEEHFHLTTYRAFLAGIGISSEEIRQSRPIPGVVAYTRGVYDLCLHYPYLQGVGALGVTEQIVAMTSPMVSRAALERGLISKDKLVHFDGHAVFDVTHAEEIYRIAEPYFDQPESREQIVLGFSLGMYYHLRLYEDVFKPCTTFGDLSSNKGLPPAFSAVTNWFVRAKSNAAGTNANQQQPIRTAVSQSCFLLFLVSFRREF